MVKHQNTEANFFNAYSARKNISQPDKSLLPNKNPARQLVAELNDMNQQLSGILEDSIPTPKFQRGTNIFDRLGRVHISTQDRNRPQSFDEIEIFVSIESRELHVLDEFCQLFQLDSVKTIKIIKNTDSSLQLKLSSSEFKKISTILLRHSSRQTLPTTLALMLLEEIKLYDSLTKN